MIAYEKNRLAAFMMAFGATIVAWAILHDLHLARIEPRHFSEFHRPLLPITHPILLAIQYAVVATTGPGLVFGALTFVACRRGPAPKRNLRASWPWFLPALAAVELIALAVGSMARARFMEGRALPYPDYFYPEHSLGLAYTQSVNLTSYVSAFIIGSLYLIGMRLTRGSAR